MEKTSIAGNEMAYIFFMQGLVIGLFIAAPVGPVGILCVNRTLSSGRMSGFISGLGAVTGDGFYAAVAAFGIRVISSFVTSNRYWITIAGGIFLSIIGVRAIFANTDLSEGKISKDSLTGNYISAAMVTLTNPVTIVVFGAIFTVLGLGSRETDLIGPAAMVSGIVTGAALCWFVLSGVVNALREKFSFSILKAFNKISGAVLIGFSFVVFVSALVRR